MSTHPSPESLPQSKSRKKRSAEVVSFEDLLAAHKTDRGPGQLPAEGVVLIGVDLELQRRMAERIGLPAPREIASDAPAPNFGAPEIAIERDSISSGAPKFGASEGVATIWEPEQFQTLGCESATRVVANDGAPKVGAPKLDAQKGMAKFDGEESSFDLRDLLTRRTRTKTYLVHPVSRIEDVFTAAERDLLKWLWERGRSVPATPRIRLVTGPNGEGARRLATQANLIYNTFKNLTRALSTKFALDIVKPERNLPTIYAIHHYSAVLERQRLAGFTGTIHKNGGGRELVNNEAEPAPRRADLSVEDLGILIGAPKFGAPNAVAGAPNFAALSGNFGAPKIAALIRNKEYTSDKEYTSSSSSAANLGAPTFVVDALFRRTGRTDVDAARLITKRCQEANATVQPDEIARLIRTAQIPPNITNPVGLLIRALPGRCAAESIANYREQWRKEDDQERRKQEEERIQAVETARSVLDSAKNGEHWDHETLEWASNILANLTEKQETAPSEAGSMAAVEPS